MNLGGLNQHQLELVDTVRSDLEWLREQVSGDIDPHGLRRLSTILRRLFTQDRDFIKAWRTLAMQPRQPIIRAVQLHNSVRMYDQTGTVIGSNQGIDAISVAIPPRRGATVITRHTTLSGFRHGSPPSSTQEDFPLPAYLRSSGMIITGTKIQRHQIIEFIANKKAGSHLDRRRRKDDTAYRLLDSAHDPQPIQVGEYSTNARFLIGDKTETYKYFEAVAIEIADSGDIQKFITEAASYRT